MIPLISLIAPVYGVEKYIRNFIISVKNQTFKNFELLLINDGTKDNSIKIAEAELKDSKINYKIINKLNGGQSSARNCGILNAKGDWVAIVDSDDTLQTNYLQNMYDVSQKVESCDVVVCDINRVSDSNCFAESNDKFMYEVYDGKAVFKQFFMHELEAGPYSLLINRHYLEKINLLYEEKSRYSEEFIFICNLFHDAKTVIHINQRLYNYCLRNGSVSTAASIEKIYNGFNEILKSNKKYINCNCDFCKDYIKYGMPRWIVATARFCSNNMNYKQYRSLMQKLDYKKYIKQALKFPKISIKLAAFCINFSLPCAYIVFRSKGEK